MSQNENQNGGLAQASTQKKISFFSAILVVMGSSIGAGIFFKAKGVLTNSQGSLVLAIFCWIIAAISVIAMALALIEISSARNDNLSLIGWTKVFNGRTTFKASKNFMFYIYLPLTYFFMPLYVILSLQDGLGALINTSGDAMTIGTSVDWLIWTIVSLVISGYFIYVSGISSRAGNIQNKIVTYIKFIPLAAVVVLGITLVGMNASGVGDISAGTVPPTTGPSGNQITTSIESGAAFSDLAPGIGMFLAISGIFFAYDGFYVAAGIQSEMAQPKKTPMAILFGLLITTVIYLFVAIAMSINGGDIIGMQDFMKKAFGDDVGRIIFGVLNLMIAIGVIGIINGFAMWAPRFTEDLIKEGELPFSIKYKNKLNENKPIVGIMYSFAISVPVVIVFTIIGALGYNDTVGYGGSDGLYYGAGMGKLYSFADLMGTWTALFAFGFIMFAIYGGLKNRKTKAVTTDQKSYFKIAAIISIISVGLALTITALAPFIDLFLLGWVNPISVELVGGNYVDIVVGRVMLIVTFFIFIGLSYGVTMIEDIVNVKKHGSIEKFEEWQKTNFIVS